MREERVLLHLDERTRRAIDPLWRDFGEDS